MNAKEVLHIMRATAPTATIEDAEAFLALCQERGLTPFTEASPIITDYVNKRGERVHTLSVKEHYAVAERWAQQCGGYTIRERRITRTEKGDIVAHIGIVSNRDYADVGKFCSRTGANFKEELAGFIVSGDAIVTAEEMRSRRPPTSRTWEWVAEKRAREAAVLQKFGREPTQSRQMYAQAITAQARAIDTHETQALLYGAPALSVAPEPPAPVSVAPVPPEPQEPLEPEPEPASEPESIARAAEPQAAPKPVPATLAEARAEWSKAWNIAKRLGLNPPLLDNGWNIEEIVEHVAILQVQIAEATATQGASE